MTLVNKQDSNSTGLRYAVEVSPGVVDGSAVWQPLEPNSYKNFGGDVKTKARMPISDSRQLKKGVVVDLDAGGGFIQDLTADNFQDPAQCFMYAALRKKSELAVATIDGTANAYQPASGGDSYYAGDLLFAKKNASSLNDGVKVVTGLPTASNIAVTDTGLVDATGGTGIISRVGFAYGAGQVSVDVSGALPKLVVTSVKATGTLTDDGSNVTDGDTVTIGGKVYTFQDTLTNVDGHVKIAATNALTLTNLFHAINRSGGTVGTDYATLTVANPRVVATNPTATTIVVTAIAGGAVGNAITTTELSSHLSWGAATLTGGSGGRSFDSFGLVPGEYVYVGSDETDTSLASANDNGFCRVRTAAAGYLEFDKTQFAMTIDNGAGKSLRIYFGRVLKNESDPTLIIKRGVQIERTLGAPDDALPTQIQAEYLVRALADNLKLDAKTADIIRLEMDFTANTNELRTGAQGVKAGTRPTIVDADAFNSTSDVSFTKMAIVTVGNAAPSPLFSFFTDFTMEIKNNVKQNKAVSVLGAFDSTPGFFHVTSSVTAYFTDVAEIQAVRDNKTITLETHFVKFNKGVTLDLPCLVMSKALADVKLNEAIMIPLGADAAAGSAVDASLNHTLLWVFWDYLPTVAA